METWISSGWVDYLARAVETGIGVGSYGYFSLY